MRRTPGLGPNNLRVSVIVPAYRRPEMLRAAVSSLLQQDLRKEAYEVLVVDSSPDDRNVKLVEALIPNAPCRLALYAKEPEGPGPSRNLGAAKARGVFLAFMDSDCRASTSWLRDGLESFEHGIGLVQGRTLPEPGSRIGVFTWYLSVEEESFIYESANIFYRKEAFEEAGGFAADSTPTADTPMGGEDVELAWRVKRNGWQSRFAPNAVVYHEVVPISLVRWLVSKRLFIWPRLARNVPEIRSFFFARYFFDRAQALFVLALMGAFGAFLHPVALALAGPYVLFRASEPSRSLSGWLRPLRVLVYLPRDFLSFLVLLGGSIRFRCVVL